MHKFAYTEILEDSFSEARRHEREAFDRVLAMLRSARDKGSNSRELIESLYRLRQLWGFLLDDLSSSENLLPDNLKARLISVGLWMIKEADKGVMEDPDRLDAVIAINSIIRDGLR